MRGRLRPRDLDGAGGDLLEEGLELREGHLDKIEVRAVGPQEAQLGPGRVEGRSPHKDRRYCRASLSKLPSR